MVVTLEIGDEKSSFSSIFHNTLGWFVFFFDDKIYTVWIKYCENKHFLVTILRMIPSFLIIVLQLDYILNFHILFHKRMVNLR